MTGNRIQPPKTEALFLRVSVEEIERYRAAACHADAENFSAWVRKALNAAAAKALR